MPEADFLALFDYLHRGQPKQAFPPGSKPLPAFEPAGEVVPPEVLGQEGLWRLLGSWVSERPLLLAARTALRLIEPLAPGQIEWTAAEWETGPPVPVGTLFEHLMPVLELAADEGLEPTRQRRPTNAQVAQWLNQIPGHGHVRQLGRSPHRDAHSPAAQEWRNAMAHLAHVLDAGLRLIFPRMQPTDPHVVRELTESVVRHSARTAGYLGSMLFRENGIADRQLTQAADGPEAAYRDATSLFLNRWWQILQQALPFRDATTALIHPTSFRA